MTRFADDSRIVEISMTSRIASSNGIDWEDDFFEVGGLKYNDDLEAYMVNDVGYLVGYAEDYAKCCGDFIGCEPNQTDIYAWDETNRTTLLEFYAEER